MQASRRHSVFLINILAQKETQHFELQREARFMPYSFFVAIIKNQRQISTPCKILGRSQGWREYAFIGRDFSSSNNDGVLICHMLISSVCLHIRHAYAFVT